MQASKTPYLLALLLFVVCAAPALADRIAAPIWGYSGDIGPEHWGQLSPEWAECTYGQRQSPINIVTQGLTPRPLPPLAFEYKPSRVQFVNNGHTLQMNYAPGSRLVLAGTDFALEQFHVHTPSENTVDGKSYPLGLHLVHREQFGRYFVVSLFLQAGAANAALPEPEVLRTWLPVEKGTVTPEGATIDAARLLPENTRSYNFSGSLTTPDCGENVRWMVMATPIEVSEGQLAAFIETLGKLKFATPEGHNSRPVQPLHGRPVTLGVP